MNSNFAAEYRDIKNQCVYFHGIDPTDLTSNIAADLDTLNAIAKFLRKEACLGNEFCKTIKFASYLE